MKIVLLSLVTTTLILGSCSKPVESVIRTEPNATPTEVDYSRVKIRDTSLSRRINILSVVETTSADLLKVQVNLRNSSRSPTTIQYAFEWFDKDGFNARADKRWLTKTIRSGEITTIAAVADNPSAVDFFFNMKKSDK